MNLEREILTCLSDVSGRLMTTKLVHSQVHLATGQDKSLNDVTAALKSLERKGDVTGVSHEDFGMRWAISDHGKLRIAE